MKSLTTFLGLLVTVFIVSSRCNARKQYFSGSHSFSEDDPLKNQQQHESHPSSTTRQYSISPLVVGSTSTSEKGTEPFLLVDCPFKNVSETKGWGIQSCGVACEKDQDCPKGKGYKCSCDGPCGLTCNKINDEKKYCDFPGRIDNGHVLVIGKFGLYDYRNQLKKFIHNQKIIFECDRGFALGHGPTGKTCRNGMWLPASENPQCIESDGPVFRWIRSTRMKRRAIKTGGGTFARSKGAGGGGGDRGSMRRPNRNKGRRLGEEDDLSFAPMSCPSLDHDEFMQVEVIKNGEDVNNTYSIGAVAKISCTPGYSVNINNETVVCEKGKWRPKLPQCSALPCRVPYIIHGTFYVGSKPLFFEELKPHSVRVELRCSKGYMVKGRNRFQCYYGEWNVDDTPECVPAGCRLPILERGIYLMNYKPEMTVESGTEVEYTCNENFRKAQDSSKNTKCDHGEWNPATPKCIPSMLFGQRNFTQDTFASNVRRSCGSPPKDSLAITYNEGIPLDFEKNHRFPHATEVMYRCIIVRPRAKNRWKIVCDDGKWIKISNNITCEGNITAEDIKLSHDVKKLINSSCVYKKVDKHVATFYNDQELTEDQLEFPFGTVLVSRCVDIGKFQLKWGMRRKCISGQWMGLTPNCEGLNQYHDYALDKSPTILFRFVNGSIAQTVDGKLLVYPGTTLHMECLYLRKFGRPSWEVDRKVARPYAEGWTDGIEHRDNTLEYRLTIDNASEKDSGLYSCSTPTRHSHQIRIIVKKVDCPPINFDSREDLIASSNSTKAGTRVQFQCANNASQMVGNKEIMCQASGTWTGGLPRCENVECPDIQTVPAMSPLAYTEVTKNGTLKKNETAPPTIKILSRAVGGKVNFSCPQGFAIQGSAESECLPSGKWSEAMPLCKEVECPPPPQPKNGYITGTPPYKAGDHAYIDCNNSFLIEGQAMIYCQDSGMWSRHSTITKCAPACTYPGSTIGATISSVQFYYPIGDSVEYGCTEGYKLVGERVLKCLPSAKWSHEMPNCKPIQEGKSGESRAARYLGLIRSSVNNGNSEQ